MGRLATYCFDHALRRRDVVGGERGGVEPADLRMREDHHVGAGDRRLPAIGSRQIGLDHRDVGMQPPQDRGVGGMLVDRHDVDEAPRLQPRDQILPDESGRTGERDFHGLGHA